jgi:hypothetical protein
VSKVYTLKYNRDDVAYQLDLAIQRIIDGDDQRPSIHGFCAGKLNMRVDDLIAIAQNDTEIGELFGTYIAHVEAYLTEAMLYEKVDRQAAQALLRQPVFSWRDRSVEAIMVQNTISYDDDTRAAILASSDPETITRIARGQTV